MKKPQLLFVAGVPAAGKSYFGRWLESHQGFIHIDPEENHLLDSLGVDPTWGACVASLDCNAFANALRQLDRPVVFNWGFPVSMLPVVAALKSAGFACWWLDANITQARAEFKRMGKSMTSFEQQVAAIDAARDTILQVFQPNVITKIDKAGVRVSPEAIWAAVRHAA